MVNSKKTIIFVSIIIGIIFLGTTSYFVYVKHNINKNSAGTELKEKNLEDNPDIAIPENAYKIEDLRDEKTNLIGKYISSDNPEIFFEIFEDYAILHENFEDGEHTDEKGSKTLEIEYYDDALWLNFQISFKIGGALTSFYSDGIDTFVWLDTIPFSYNKCFFIKQD